MKLWNYIILSIILTILLQLGGVGVAEAVSSLIGLEIDLVTETGSMNYTTFWTILLVLLTASIGGGIAIGYITKSPTEKITMLPFVTLSVILFISTFYGIIISPMINGWVFWVVFTIFSALMIGFIYSIFEWYAGGGD